MNQENWKEATPGGEEQQTSVPESIESATPDNISEHRSEQEGAFANMPLPTRAERKRHAQVDKKAAEAEKTLKVATDEPSLSDSTHGTKTSPSSLLGLSKKTWILIVALVVVVIAALIVLFTVILPGGGGALAARVNGDKITERQLEASIEKLRLQNPQIFAPGSGTSEDKIRASILDELINETLVMQAASDHDVEITDEQINVQITALEQRYGSKNQFNEVLKEQGFTLDSLKLQLKYSLTAQAIASKLVPESSVTDKEARAYYTEHKEDYSIQAGKRVSQILFPLNQEKQAAAVLKQLKGGADFAEMAKKYSTDTATAAKGGDMGWPTGQPYVQAFQTAVDKLEKGELSGLVKSSNGYHIILCTNVRKTSQEAFAQVKSSVKATLLNIKRNEAAQNLVADLRKKASITIYDKVVKDFEARTSSQGAAASSSE